MAAQKAEGNHEAGRNGVAAVKRWLEATTWIELPWEAYNNARDCTLLLVNDEQKIMDLGGYYLGPPRNRIWVESKNYSSDSKQPQQYKEFLLDAYKHSLNEKEQFGSAGQDLYLWVTTHPFSVTDWNDLTEASYLKSRIEDAGDILLDEELVRDVASRTSVLVYNKRQESWSLTRGELLMIRPLLQGREGGFAS